MKIKQQPNNKLRDRMPFTTFNSCMSHVGPGFIQKGSKTPTPKKYHFKLSKHQLSSLSFSVELHSFHFSSSGSSLNSSKMHQNNLLPEEPINMGSILQPSKAVNWSYWLYFYSFILPPSYFMTYFSFCFVSKERRIFLFVNFLKVQLLFY